MLVVHVCHNSKRYVKTLLVETKQNVNHMILIIEAESHDRVNYIILLEFFFKKYLSN
jgi:hypothetical protein